MSCHDQRFPNALTRISSLLASVHAVVGCVCHTMSSALASVGADAAERLCRLIAHGYWRFTALHRSVFEHTKL
ncbi:hypothetical protein V8C86DRAFT_2914398, partial [Haematococcus lacustris]